MMRLLDTKQMTKRTVRLMLEVEPNDLFAIAKALRSQSTGVPVVTTLEDNVRLMEISQTIISRISEEQAHYPGHLYEIWAKGKRRAHLGWKREPDMMIGKEFGRSFLDACIHYWVLQSEEQYSGRVCFIHHN
jgi:hypothetical protein